MDSSINCFFRTHLAVVILPDEMFIGQEPPDDKVTKPNIRIFGFAKL